MPIVPRSPIQSPGEVSPSTPTKLPPIYNASSQSPERKKVYGTSEWAAPFWSNMQAEQRTTQPLREAAEAGRADLVRALLVADAESRAESTSMIPLRFTFVDGRNNYGESALHYAAFGGHESVVTVLLEFNAQTALKNRYGKTAQAVALGREHHGVVAILERAALRAKAEVEAAKRAAKKAAAR